MKELELVKRINGQAGRCVAADFTLDGIARFGHLAFVLYGLWLWFGGRKEDRTARRTAAVTALLAWRPARSCRGASGNCGSGPAPLRGTAASGILPATRRTPLFRAITP